MNNKFVNRANFDVKIDNIINFDNDICNHELDSELLDEEIHVFNMIFKNKFYVHNLTDCFLFENNIPSEKYINYYKKLAKTGVGLIFTGAITIYPHIKHKTDKGVVFDEKLIKEWDFSEVLEAIHSSGSKMFCTLQAAGGRLDNDYKFMNIFNYSSSLNKCYGNSTLNCARMSDLKCNEIADQFGNAASFLQGKGFDGVLIDGSLRNVLGEFSSGEFNRRVFGYFSNYEELAIKILRNINKLTNKFPIIYKITLFTLIDFVYENSKNISSLKNIEQGLNLNKIIKFLENLTREGVDGFVFEFGVKENEFLYNFTPNLNTEFINNIYQIIKDKFMQLNLKNKFNEDVKLFYKGNVNNLSNNLIKNTSYDFIDVTRIIYSDLNYLKNKKTQKISNLCIKCCNCNDKSEKKCKVECLINPWINSNELVKNYNINEKNILIIGAGLSGIMCAITLAERGFKVELIEKNNTVNSTGKLNEIFGFDKYLKNYNNYIENKLNEYIKTGAIKLFFNNCFEMKNNELKKYNTVIVATGYNEKNLNIPGAILKNVKSLNDILSSKKYIINNGNIVIYARSEISLKFALYLKTQNKKVSVVVKDSSFMFEMPNALFTYYLYIFKSLDVKLYVPASVKRIHDDSAEIVINSKIKNKDIFSVLLNMKSNKIYPYEPQTITIDSDLFIYEPEITPNNKLYYDIVKSGYAGEVYMIGNALEICDMGGVIKSGFYLGKNI